MNGKRTIVSFLDISRRLDDFGWVGRMVTFNGHVPPAEALQRSALIAPTGLFTANIVHATYEGGDDPVSYVCWNRAPDGTIRCAERASRGADGEYTVAPDHEQA